MAPSRGPRIFQRSRSTLATVRCKSCTSSPPICGLQRSGHFAHIVGAASKIVPTFPSTSCAAHSLHRSHHLRRLETLAGVHLSVPRRKNGPPRPHDGRDWSQHPGRHFIDSLLFVEAINTHVLPPQWNTAYLRDAVHQARTTGFDHLGSEQIPSLMRWISVRAVVLL